MQWHRNVSHDPDAPPRWQRAGLSTLEAPVSWKNAPGSRVGLIGDPLNMLADIARFVWREGG